MTQTLRVVLRVALVAIVAVHVTAASASAQASADLYVQTSVWPNGPVPTGSSLSYFIEIDNFGPGDAETVVLNDRLPPQVTFGYAFPEECVFDEPSHSLSCDLGELPAGFFAFVEISVTAPSSPMTIVNSATVSSTTSDADSTNNTSTVATEVAQFNLSDLAVTVAVSPETALVHRVLTFVTNVTNLGPHDAAGVLLKLTPPVNADIISISSSQGPCETAELGDFDCRIGPLTVGASATITLTVKPQKDGLSLTFAYATGYGDTLLLHENFHVTVNPDGTATSVHDNPTLECK